MAAKNSAPEMVGNPTESGLLETIESNVDCSYETIEKNNLGDDNYPYPTAKKENSQDSNISTTATATINGGKAQPQEESKNNHGHINNSVDDADGVKGHQNENEEPISQVIETIDVQHAFPDHPLYDPNALLKTSGDSNLTAKAYDDDMNKNKNNNNNNNNNNSGIDNNSNENNNTTILESVDVTADTSPQGNDLKGQGHTDRSRTSAIEQNLNASRGHSKQELFNPRSLSEHTFRKSHSTIPKPKSSLGQPEYKYQQEEFLDQNMLISYTKLDGLLCRLFAHYGRRGGPAEKPLPFLDDGKSDLISMDPVTWNLRPMTAVQKETLDSELEFLEETLCPKQVIRRLFMDGILTHMDYNQITRTEGQGEKAMVRLLVGTLKRRGEKAYPLFMQALNDLDYTRISQRLNETERSLSHGVLEDQRKSEMRREVERSNYFNVSNMAATTASASSIRPPIPEDENSEEILRRFLQSAFENSPGHGPKVAADGPKFAPDDLRGRHLHSGQLEKQLNDINVELKALHENLNLLQSARSSSGTRLSSGGNPTSSTSNTQAPVDLKDSNTQPSIQSTGDNPRATDQDNMTNRPTHRNDNSNTKQKSGTCAII